MCCQTLIEYRSVILANQTYYYIMIEIEYWAFVFVKQGEAT